MSTRKLAFALAMALIISVVPFAALAGQAGVNILVSPTLVYDSVYPIFTDGLAAVYTGGKWGFVNSGGTAVVPARYDNFQRFNEGFAPVAVGDWTTGMNWGFINTSGNEIVSPRYFQLQAFSEGFAPFATGDWESHTWGYVNTSGNEVIPARFGNARGFSGGLAAVYIDGMWGFINTSGNEVVPPRYAWVGDFSDDRAPVQSGNPETGYLWGVIDRSGNEVVPPKYSYVGSFNDGLASVVLDGMTGFINTSGNEVVPPRYFSAWYFSEGMAGFMSGDQESGYKYGFINTSGNEVVPPRYDFISGRFSDGLAVVGVGDWVSGIRYGVIDKTGNEVVPPTYDWIGNFNEGIAAANLGAGWGVIDSTGAVVLPFEYDWISDINDGIAWVMKDGRYGIIQAGDPPAPPDAIDSAAPWAREGILSAIEKGFVPELLQNNYSNVITRAEFARLAVSYLEYAAEEAIADIVAENGDPEKANHTFSDTSDPFILAAYRLGVITGTRTPTDNTPGTFNPGGQFTREQAATMLMNLCKVLGYEVDNAPDSGFADINLAASWAIAGINFVRAQEFMLGSAGNFNPRGTYTRQESIMMFDNMGD